MENTSINVDSYHLDPNEINLDLMEYLNQHQNEILNQINNSIFPIKFILDIRLRFTVANPGNEHTPEDEIWGAIKNDPYLVYSRLYELPQDLINDLLRKFDEECLTGASNKRLIEIYLADVEIFPVNGLGGSAYIPMPFNSHCVINVQNNDNKCFGWAIISAYINTLYHSNNQIQHPERTSSYEPYMDLLNQRFDFSNIQYPMELDKIRFFEKKNNVNINVFGIKSINENINLRNGYQTVPLQISNYTFPDTINLLLLLDRHYVWIKDLRKFLGPDLRSCNRTHASTTEFFCIRCFSLHYSESAYNKHINLCGTHKPSLIKMPEEN